MRLSGIGSISVKFRAGMSIFSHLAVAPMARSKADISSYEHSYWQAAGAGGLYNQQSIVSDCLGLKLMNSYFQKDKEAKTRTRTSRLEKGGFYVVNGLGNEQESEGHLLCRNLHYCDDIRKGATALGFDG